MRNFEKRNVAILFCVAAEFKLSPFDTREEIKNMKRDEAIEIYKCEHSRYNNFREIQWKMNVTIWTLIVFGINAADLIGKYLNSYWIVSLCFLLFCAHSIFVWLAQRSLDASKQIERNIVNALNDGSHEDLNLRIEIKILPDKKWMWFLFQLLCTLVLLAVFAFISISSHCSPIR